MQKLQFIIFGLILLCGQTLFGNIINIPDDYSTIQEGINASVNGDTVLVQPGTYVENINYNGKNIVVASLFLTTQDTSYIYQTVIDAIQGLNAVTFMNEEDNSSVFIGFTVKNVHNPYPYPVFGIKCSSASPSITNNFFHNNDGAIGCLYSSPNIIDNYFFDNGCGICIVGGSCYIMNNRISNNGEGIYLNSSLGMIINNDISKNEAGIRGEFYNDEILNNTIAYNIGVYGYGIECSHCSPYVANNIIWGNSYNFQFFGEQSHPIISYCCIEGGFPSQGINAGGNIYDYPLFADPQNGDFHLTWANYPIPDSTMSPCIDAGDPDPQYNDPDGTRNDMGAYYFDQTVGVDDENNPFIETELFKNYPNPFNKITTIRYFLPKYTEVKIQIYNLKGQLVETIVDSNKPTGYYTVEWNSKGMSSGIYFYKLSTRDKTFINKMILLK